MSTHPVATSPEPPAAPLWDWLKAGLARPETRPAWIGGAICLGLLALIFRDNLQHLVSVWSNDENYSHGFLVPLISLYFANEAARRGPIAVHRGVGIGLALIGLAVLGRLAAAIVPIGVLAEGSFLVGLVGLVALMGGYGSLRRFAFPLFFLVFMIPIPTAIYSMIASPLQMWVSQVASVLLNGIGIPVLREGNTMTLPGDVKLFVAEACSGMRQLTGFLALTTAVAYLGRRPPWARLAVVASSVPIALVANLSRVTLTGWIMYHDPRYAKGTFHTLEGILMMGLGMVLLAAFCRALEWAVALGGAPTPASPEPSPQPEPGPAPAAAASAWPRADQPAGVH